MTEGARCVQSARSFFAHKLEPDLSRPLICTLVLVTALAVLANGCSSDGGGGLAPGQGLGVADTSSGGGADVQAGGGDTTVAPGRDTGGGTTPATRRDASDGPYRSDTGPARRDVTGTPGRDIPGTPGRDTSGTTGGDTSGGGACGNIDFEGVCEGTVLTYCAEGALEIIDCADDGLDCAYIAPGYGNGCAAAPQADCYLEDEQGVLLMLCTGTDAACVFESEDKATCRENVYGCGNTEYLCSGDLLVLPCDVEIDVQALAFECPADGGTCAGAEGDKSARCIGLVEGSVCDSDNFICGDGLVCGDVDPESGVGTCKTGEPPVSDGTCGTYCDVVMENCTGDHKAYDDAEACATACAEIPADGSPGDAAGNTVQCRLHFAGAAGSDAEGSAAAHCPNAAADGGELCVAPEPATTYASHVQPILAAKCADCHTTAGSGGHNGAAVYADTQALSASYAKCVDEGLLRGACFGVRVHDGTMPKDAGCTGDPAADAENEACLTAAEIETLDAWIAGGMPE